MKKLLFTSTCALMVIWVCGRTSAVLAGALFTRGDANSDRAVNIADASFVLQALFAGAKEPDCLDAADANDDGRVNISDAVFVLNFLFGGGAFPPPPSPGRRCHGLDPTADGLDCAGGFDLVADPPAVELLAVVAPAPGVRQRSRTPLPELAPGVFRVKEGVSFALLVIAAAHPGSRRPIALADPDDPSRGNPDTLQMVADAALGDPQHGGAAAGTNLAPWFLGDLELWSDAIHLEEEAAMRIAGDGPLAPAPGTYTFTAAITDVDCGVSSPTAITLEVASASAPELFIWTEATPAVRMAPLPHDAGSGAARVSRDDGVLVVIEARPNGRQPGAVPDPRTLEVAAHSVRGGSRIVTQRFQRDDDALRWSLWLEPGDVLLGPGNTELAASVGRGAATGTGTASLVIEVEVGYGNDIQPLWDRHCSGCHEGPGAEKGLVLVAPGRSPEVLWRRIVNVFAAEPAITSSAPLLVRPYFPERSYLYHKLRGTHLEPAIGGEGERMPLGGPPYLAPQDVDDVRSWITQGAGE